jgi:hypothetical protein
MPKAIYTAPSHDKMGKLARHGVLQPPVPMMVQLMGLLVWRLGILYAMGPEGMAAAGKGLAHLDKGMTDDGGLRIVRSFVRNPEGQFVDSDLQCNVPLLFDVLKILMEEYDFQNVALQKMLTQTLRCTATRTPDLPSLSTMRRMPRAFDSELRSFFRNEHIEQDSLNPGTAIHHVKRRRLCCEQDQSSATR